VFAAHVAGDLERLSEFLPWPAVTADAPGAATWLGRYDKGEGGRVLAAGIVDDGALVGGIVLFNHSEAMGTVELGCWAIAAAEGRGLVRAACLEALVMARRGLEVARVEWHCDPRNTRSGVLAERLGFVHEGRLRSSYVLRGERLDTDVYGLVEGEIDQAIAR
jgi:ribosomal-protein-serine acetyltransferase